MELVSYGSVVKQEKVILYVKAAWIQITGEKKLVWDKLTVAG